MSCLNWHKRVSISACVGTNVAYPSTYNLSALSTLRMIRVNRSRTRTGESSQTGYVRLRRKHWQVQKRNYQR